MRLLLIIGVLLLVSGCGSTAKYLESEPSMHFPTRTVLALPANIQPYLVLHCIKAADIKYEDEATTDKATTDKPTTNSRCLYISADASRLGSATVDSDTRDQIIRTLLNISDLNCQTFRQRAFANRAGFDYGKKFFQDVSTAVSAGTATVSAPFSAALDVTNLVVGKGVDTFNATYYFDKTFQAMEDAIRAERAQQRALITARQEDKKNYLIGDALADISAYDDACSIKSGLARLSAVAQKGLKDSETFKLQVESASTGNKVQTYIDTFGQ